MNEPDANVVSDAPLDAQPTQSGTTADHAADAQPVQSGTAEASPSPEGDRSALDGVPTQTDNREREVDGEQDVSQDPEWIPEDAAAEAAAEEAVDGN